MAREEKEQSGELNDATDAGGGDDGQTDDVHTLGESSETTGDGDSDGGVGDDVVHMGRSAGGDGPGVVQRVEDIDVETISADAWRLLRTAAGYEQRAIEREMDNLKQAHISMLENDTRGLSTERLERLFDLYIAELSDKQVCALVELF